MIHFINYANQRYRSIQEAQLCEASATGVFDTVHGYTREWLEDTPYYRENQAILDLPRGDGYWAWKPYIILDAMQAAMRGDLVVYMDSGDVFVRSSGLREALMASVSQSHIGLREQGEPSRKMTKRDCFVKMGCDNERYWNAKQPEAGFVVVLNTAWSEQFVEEWLRWCRDENVLTDMENVCGMSNFPDFIDHRHDQSILTNLVTREEIPVDRMMHRWLSTNVRHPQ